MHSLNPFIRAFFRSPLPAQCTPVNQHILLVPTTEVLLTSKDKETNATYAELASSEEFLGSHVLRIPEPPMAGEAKGGGNARENRGKAKQFTTFNGRTVVVKESFVYSNKGFRNLNQAQLLSDSLYYNDGLEAQQWLIYYISRPLIGSFESIKITTAHVPSLVANIRLQKAHVQEEDSNSGITFGNGNPGKKDIKTFSDLLNNFPMIARQMQPGIERVFKEFTREVEKPLPACPVKSPSSQSRRTSTASTLSNGNGSLHSKYSNGYAKSPAVAGSLEDNEEDHLRRSLETAVTAAIDLFQLVDKQQLSLLGATTDLTGPLVERLIERYITEQLHDSILFPRISDGKRLEDLELESRVHQMAYIDVAQVGIDIEDGRAGKLELTKRLDRGVEEFRKLGVAGGPQQMIEVLLATQKTLSTASEVDTGKIQTGEVLSEKSRSVMTMSADTLVSLLLLVVIRSQVRHLQACLTYIRSFIIIDDVENGEMGYALSTFEAVLSYIATDAGGLRKASRKNKCLWQATRKGLVSDIKSILEPDEEASSDDIDSDDEIEKDGDKTNVRFLKGAGRNSGHSINGQIQQRDDHVDAVQSAAFGAASDSSNLAHVFPFQAEGLGGELRRPRSQKRVSMDLRSLSGSSEFSFKSRTTTLDSRNTVIEGDTSIEKLCQTQDTSGHSILMMAVENRQAEALCYLLSLPEYFSIDAIFDDCKSDGTTLLSAAVQTGDPEIIEVLIQHLLSTRDKRRLASYLTKQDQRGRTAAHYLFNAPQLMTRLGNIIPWRLKDNIGQTPLLAICRSWDNANYVAIVNDALQFATQTQDGGGNLHLDDHVDSKGNTLLHVVSDPYLALRMLQHADADANAANDKKFTPLMVASKYGRFDVVRAMFLDKRVDLAAKEHRGMTAVELAKDDDVRNRIDDMVLVSNTPAPDGRVTAVVRSFFMDDASIRLIIKSATRGEDGMIAVTTCRRSLGDFEKLAKWLSIEHPASWLPLISGFRSPFQIPSKPSRAVLNDVQIRLDKFLKIMLAHSTFSTHELLWEFILVPEINPEMMAARSRKKAELRTETVREEYEPIEDVRDVEIFVGHARDSIRGVNHSVKSVIRRINNIRNTTLDFYTSLGICTAQLDTLPFLPGPHIQALNRLTSTFLPPESSPQKALHTSFLSILSTLSAILYSLSRPPLLAASLQSATKAIDRHTASLRRSDRWPLGLLDETRKSIHTDAQERLEESKENARNIGCELRYVQERIAGELAGWQDLHAKLVRRSVKDFVRATVIKEKERLEGMRRAVRGVVESKKV